MSSRLQLNLGKAAEFFCAWLTQTKRSQLCLSCEPLRPPNQINLCFKRPVIVEHHPHRKSALSPVIPQLDFNSGISWERRDDDCKSPKGNRSRGQTFSHIFDGVFIFIFCRNISFTWTQWVSWGWIQIVSSATALEKSNAATRPGPPSFCPAATWWEKTPPSPWPSKVTLRWQRAARSGTACLMLWLGTGHGSCSFVCADGCGLLFFSLDHSKSNLSKSNRL